MENAMIAVSDRALALRAAAADKLKALTEAAKEGLFAGAPPSIGCKGTRFVVREGASEQVLEVTRLNAIVVAAKAPLDKVFYLNSYKDGDDGAPDCFSRDGIVPDAQATLKQNAACAGCPRNVFGTAHDKDGNPTGGKACSDIKVVAVFLGQYLESGALKLYQFRIPPASLTPWNKYVTELEQRGAALPEVITSISFDPTVSYPKYVFTPAGTVNDEMLDKIYAAMDSDEAKKITEPKPIAVAPPVVAQPVVAQPVVTPPVVDPTVGIAPPTVEPAAGITPSALTPVAEPPVEKKKGRRSTTSAPTPDLGISQGIQTPAATPDLGLGLTSAVTPPQGTMEVIPPDSEPAQQPQVGGGLSEDFLRSKLNL